MKSSRAAFTRAMAAVAVQGEVVVCGNRTSEALTPEAALKTADELRQAAEEALAQRRAYCTALSQEARSSDL
jgi:hypothetical protein